MNNSIFPISLECRDNGYYVESPGHFRPLLNLLKPKDVTYFCFAVDINSPTSVTFYLYDMYNSVYGGIGQEILRFTAEVNEKETRRDIVAAARYEAARRRKAELEAAEKLIIDKLQEEVLKEVYK